MSRGLLGTISPYLGSIPSEFGLLVNLLDLSLSSNRLSGNLPYSLSSCIALEHVFLQSNLFSGEIFDGLRNLRSLQYLDASQNNLSGAIPKDLGGLQYLTYMNPEYGLSGIVSTEGDVYRYGILLLEMFAGKRPTDDDPNDSPSLCDLVRTGLQSQVMDVIDPVILLHEHNHRLNDEAMNCIISVREIGLACPNELPRDRMLVNDVVNGLRKTVHMAQ